MTEKTVPLVEATPAQLREYATVHMGLEIDGRATRNTIISKMHAAGFTGDAITVFAVEEPEPEMSDTRITGNTMVKNGRTYRRIQINTEPGAGGDRAIPVGVNGKIMYIPRGTPQWVPQEYVEVLNNAEMLVYDEFDGSDLGGLKPPRRAKAYPFSQV